MSEPIKIYVKSGLSRGKAAAAAVHAALKALKVHPGVPVIVLGANNTDIESRKTVIRDHGKTEVEPGTMTAGTDYERPEPEFYEVSDKRAQDHYTYSRICDGFSQEEADAEYRTWIAEHDRRVAEKAWAEGRESFAADLLKPLGDNLMRPQSENPYKWKGPSDE